MPQDTTSSPDEEAEVITEAREVLANWHRRARESQMAAFNAAKWFRFWHFMIGVPLIILTAVTGTEGYRSDAVVHHDFHGVPTEAVEIIVPIVVALQTFLSYSQRAEKFQHAGAQYSSVRRKMEQGAVFLMADNANAMAFMDTIRSTLDTLAEEAPDPPFVVRKWTLHRLKADTASQLFAN